MNKADMKKLLAYLKTCPESKDRDGFIRKLEKDTKPIKPRSAKNKGKNFQNQVAQMISDTLNIPWGNDDEDLIASRQMGMNGVDIILRGEAKAKFNYATECKATETFGVWTVIDQVKANLGGFKNWIIFHRKNGRKGIVVIDMEHFFELYKKTLDT